MKHSHCSVGAQRSVGVRIVKIGLVRDKPQKVDQSCSFPGVCFFRDATMFTGWIHGRASQEGVEMSISASQGRGRHSREPGHGADQACEKGKH